MSLSTSNADVFQAIAAPARRSILDRLRQGEQPVKYIAIPLNMSLSAVSQHLSVLCEVGLVTQRKLGRQRLYRLNPEPLRQVSDWLAEYKIFWKTKLDALDSYLEDSSCNDRLS